MSSTPPPAAVIFDWGGTLTPWHAVDVRAAWVAYAAARAPGATDAEVHALAEQLHLAEDAAWALSRDHQRSASLADVFAAAGIPLDAGDAARAVEARAGHDEAGHVEAGHAAGLAAYHAAWEPHTWTDPEAVPTLVALRERGLKIGLLSNTLWSRELHEEVLARDGVLGLLDGAIYTSEIPWTKPHPEAFHAAMRALGVVDPATVVFVGDRPFDDIHGAQQVGMRAVLVPHSDIPPVQRGHTEGTPDAVVHRLSELVAVIDSWLASGAGDRVVGEPGEGVDRP